MSLGSLMRSTIVMCLCTIAGKYREDYKCSDNLQKDCANASQLCGLKLAPKTEPMGVQSAWPTDHAWAADACGCSLTCLKYPEESSSKSKISRCVNDFRKLLI